MIEELRKLAPRIDNYMVGQLDRLMRKARAEGRPVVELDVGISHGALKRAGLFFVAHIQQDDADIEDAGIAFTYAWCQGEHAAMRRVVSAISSPAAKGREVEIVMALAKGASIEEALAGSETAPVTKAGNVVEFRR